MYLDVSYDTKVRKKIFKVHYNKIFLTKSKKKKKICRLCEFFSSFSKRTKAFPSQHGPKIQNILHHLKSAYETSHINELL